MQQPLTETSQVQLLALGKDFERIIELSEQLSSLAKESKVEEIRKVTEKINILTVKILSVESN